MPEDGPSVTRAPWLHQVTSSPARSRDSVTCRPGVTVRDVGEPAGGERAPLTQGDYVRILVHAHDQADGNPAFGMVGESLPVGGLVVAQAGAGLGVFAPGDLQRVSPADIPRDALADIHRRAGLTPPDPRPAR